MIPDIEKFLPVAIFIKGHHNTAQVQHWPFIKMATGRNFSMSGFNSGR
jgi:hypothetical protein